MLARRQIGSQPARLNQTLGKAWIRRKAKPPMDGRDQQFQMIAFAAQAKGFPDSIGRPNMRQGIGIACRREPAGKLFAAEIDRLVEITPPPFLKEYRQAAAVQDVFI